MTENRAKPPEFYEKRNEELYNDFHKGMSIRDMMNKYELSHARIYAIVNRLNKREEK